jgi:recombinational DNA repair protein RecR
MASLDSGVCKSEMCKHQRDFIENLTKTLRETLRKQFNFCKECKSLWPPEKGNFCPCCSHKLRWTKYTRKDPKVYY